jgi:hypothetical protein
MRSNDWLSIETAPKNSAGRFYGPLVLIWDTATDQPWPAQWGAGGPDNAGCWIIPNDHAVNPEHNEIWPEKAAAWMPIAAPWIALEKGTTT